jgi:ppGpp synthetase/RelA/SpoT-type nucleotidyltranferase
MPLFNPEVLAEFTQIKALLENSLSGLEHELRRKIQSSGIHLHSFSSRLKTEESLKGKASRPDRTYSSLWEITDLIGFRIVTAFEDSIDEIAELIEKNFSIDLKHSRNRLQYEDHERFGYRSLHYVCRLPENLNTPSTLQNLRFEIQVRTALQDVWAEIEHDLGYKASDIAPSKLRRRFSRVSSLLEIADEELVSIKKELKQYIEGKRDHSKLDIVSLRELSNHPELKK